MPEPGVTETSPPDHSRSSQSLNTFSQEEAGCQELPNSRPQGQRCWCHSPQNSKQGSLPNSPLTLDGPVSYRPLGHLRCAGWGRFMTPSPLPHPLGGMPAPKTAVLKGSEFHPGDSGNVRDAVSCHNGGGGEGRGGATGIKWVESQDVVSHLPKSRTALHTTTVRPQMLRNPEC